MNIICPAQQDLQYTTVFAYLNILLHSSIADLLLNPYYCPPDANARHVKYLRPRSDPSELILWQQGLMPRSMNRFAGVGGGGRGGLSMMECEALSSGTYARMLNYWNLHMSELPLTSQSRLELISSKHRGRLFTIATPHQIMRRTAQHSVIPPNVESDNDIDVFCKSVMPVDVYREQSQARAAVKIQLWFVSTQTLLRTMQNLPEGSDMRIALSKRNIREILRALLMVIYSSRMHLQYNVTAISKQQVSCIVDELVCNAVDFCCRRDHLLAGNKVSMSASGMASQGKGGAPSGECKKKKSLAAKLMKGGKKKFSKMKKFF
jgi:hypothetical protein